MDGGSNDGSGKVIRDTNSPKLKTIVEEDDNLHADWIDAKSKKYVKSSKQKIVIRHLSVIYKKSLHDVCGTYVVVPDILISDYIFLSSVSKASGRHHNRPF